MHDSVLLLISFVVVAIASRKLWPFARCWSCRGSGRSGGSNSRRWGACRRCGGSGKRRRIGAPR